MVFNLIDENWLPVVPRSGGERRWIKPADIADPALVDVEFAWGRPDFNVATYELLIGLLSVAFPPDDDDHWRELLDAPPTVAELDKALEPLRPWFNLDGDGDGNGPRFMQDLEDFEGKPGKLESLFVDGPGDNTDKNGIDLFVKCGLTGAISRAAAAVTLYALQSYTFETAAGTDGRHFSALRSAGPLVTLVKPHEPATLWAFVWANVLDRDDAPEDLADQSFAAQLFPWCGDTPTTSKEAPFEIGRGHPLQAFFGMPRRVRLELSQGSQECALTGKTDEPYASGFRREPSGIKYGASWRHPLTPYLHGKNGTSPIRCKARRIGFNEWSGIIYGDQRFSEKGHGRSPAKCITQYRNRTRRRAIPATIVTSGFVAGEGKIVDYLEAEVPLILARDDEMQQALESLAHRLVSAADQIANALRTSLRACLDADSGKTPLEGPIESLWSATEQPFRDHLRQFAELPDVDAMDDEIKGVCGKWRSTLEGAALAAFDRAVPPDSLINKRPSEQATIIDARKQLVLALKGFGKGGKAFFKGLGLDLPDTKKKSRRGKAA